MKIRSILLLSLLVLVACGGTDAFIRIRRIKNVVSKVGKGIVTGVKKTGEGIVKGVNILKDGCCGVHPSVCRMQNEFKNRQVDIKRKAAVINLNWVKVKRISAEVKSANHYNNLIYQHIRRITLVSESTIQVLDPKIITKFNNVTEKLRKAVEHKNETVLKYGIDQIADEYDNTKGESHTQLLDASGIGGFQQTSGYIQMTADMFRMMKLNAVAKFMETDVAKYMNKAKMAVNKLFGFHYLEKLAERNKVLRGVLNVLGFYNKYLSFHGGIFTLMNVMNKLTGWITDLATCNRQKKDLEKNIVNLRKDHTTINKNFVDISKYVKSAENNWKLVREQTISEAVFDQLVTIQDIAKRASSQSASSAKAQKAIATFRQKARRASPKQLIVLQKSLEKALGDVTYTAECYERKLAMYEAVYRGCKIGKGSFVDLYERAIIDFKPNDSGCRDSSGLPYTTRQDVQKFLKQKSEKEEFETNCLLNSGLKQALTCDDIHSGFTVSQVASKYSISYQDANKLKKSCPLPVLNSRENTEICSMSRFISLKKIYKVYPDVSKNEVLKAFSKC